MGFRHSLVLVTLVNLGATVGGATVTVKCSPGYQKNHCCAIMSTGALKCWGANENGQLGYEDTADRGVTPGQMGDNLPIVDVGLGRTCKTLALSLAGTCCLLDNDDLKCWGDNYQGSLGTGDGNDRGDEPGEMGDNLLAIDFGSSGTTQKIAAGPYHVCALREVSGVVGCYCFGWGNGGALGYEDTYSRGWAPSNMGNNLPAVDVGFASGTLVDVVAKSSGTCVQHDSGAIKCWGHAFAYGSTTVEHGRYVNTMGDNLPEVDLGTGFTTDILFGGYTGVCSISTGGDMKCFSSEARGLCLNSFGYPGFAENTMGDTLSPLSLGSGRTVVDAGVGSGYICVLLDNNQFKCCGRPSGSSHQPEIGYEDATDRYTNAQMGDALPAIDFGVDGIGSLEVQSLGVGAEQFSDYGRLPPSSGVGKWRAANHRNINIVLKFRIDSNHTFDSDYAIDNIHKLDDGDYAIDNFHKLDDSDYEFDNIHKLELVVCIDDIHSHLDNYRDINIIQYVVDDVHCQLSVIGKLDIDHHDNKCI
eukprot:6461880-Amphidinium_carterae.1